MIIQKDSLEIFKQNVYYPTEIGLVSNNAYLSVVATNKCNRACPYCINSETDHTLQLSIKKMRRTVKEAVEKYGIKEAIILGGEPTLHPDICEMITGLYDAGIQKVRLTTNGIALTNQLLIDMIRVGLYGLNISYHNEDFISRSRLKEIFDIAQENGIKVRVNTNIWRNNHDSLDSFMRFYETLKGACDEVRVSNIIPKDSFSVNPQNNDEAAKMILSDAEYNSFFENLIEYLGSQITCIENPLTLGFVRYVFIPTKLPVIVNWNISSKVAEQVCENDIENRRINTFKCLVSGNISISWNENNTIIK